MRFKDDSYYIILPCNDNSSSEINMFGLDNDGNEVVGIVSTSKNMDVHIKHYKYNYLYFKNSTGYFSCDNCSHIEYCKFKKECDVVFCNKKKSMYKSYGIQELRDALNELSIAYKEAMNKKTERSRMTFSYDNSSPNFNSN